MQNLTVWDLVLTPIYLALLGYLGKRHRDKNYPVGNPLRKYYLPGLYVKFGGAIFIALIYEYYYGGGDTYNFFSQAKVINSSLSDSFETWFQLVRRTSPEANPKLYDYASQMPFYIDPSSYTVGVVAAIFGLFCFTSYLPIALLFAYISYTGMWAMYKTFVNLYPRLAKPLAVVFLFIPSTFVWGSAVFKDTICMFGLGWMVTSTFRLFINRDFSLKNIVIIVSSFYLVGMIKVYILLSFLPALSLWLLMSYSYKIQSAVLRWMLNIGFIGLITAAFFYFTSQFAQELNRYSLENITKTAQVTKEWISYSTTDEGSGYDLGDFEPTFAGMLSKFPQAVAVTLFRPFLWEVKKVIVLLSAIEALLFLYFTLKVLFTRFWHLKVIFKDPNLLFCLIFSIVFAFSVGISSYNFGALSRYKIPCLPFYGAALVILTYAGTKAPSNEAASSAQAHRKQLEPV